MVALFQWQQQSSKIKVQIFGMSRKKLVFEHSKSQSQSEVNVTKIGDTLSYGFPQTVNWVVWYSAMALVQDSRFSV